MVHRGAKGDKRAEDLVALDDALKDLAALDPRKSQIIELRFFGGLSILGIVLRIIIGIDIPFLSLVALCINGLLGLVAFVGWLVLLINAFQGKYFKLPVIGDYAEKYSNQGL